MIFRRFVPAMFCCSWGVLTKLQKLMQPSESGSSTNTHDEEQKGKMSWEDFYMNAAVLAAQRSNDPVTQVGAVLVDERRRIIGIGWNGMPIGCPDSVMEWDKKRDTMVENKHSFVCHAEFNAMALTPVQNFDGKKVKLYTTLNTCISCAKIVVQHEIKDVYYLSDKKHDDDPFKAAVELYKDAKHPGGKEFDRHENAPVVLDFTFMDKGSKESGGLLSPEEPKAKETRTTITEEKEQQLSQKNKKGERIGRISWDEFYMGLAILASKRSAHQDTKKVGAVLVNTDKKVVGIGWNDLPIDVKKKKFIGDKCELEFDCHAAINAIVFKTASVDGGKIYTTHFPCNECMKLVIQSGIKEIHYLSDEYADVDKEKLEAACDMLRKTIDIIGERKFVVTETRKTTPIILDFGYLDPPSDETK